MTPLRILVTGASGFIGRRLVLRLVDDGHDVEAVVRPGGVAPAGARRVEQDLARPWPGPAGGRLDAVVYLAQSRRYREFPEGAPELAAVGIDSVVAAADLARRRSARQFVFASTGSVYRPSFQPLAEDAAQEPAHFYARSKACAELLLGAYRDVLDVKIVRPFFVYGPGQGDGMAVAGMVRKVLAGEALYLEPAAGEAAESSGGLRFSPLLCADAVECLMRLLGSPGPRTLNLASDQVVSVRQVGELVGELSGRPPRFVISSRTRAGDLTADTSALRRALGTPPRFTPLRDGLRSVLDATKEIQ